MKRACARVHAPQVIVVPLLMGYCREVPGKYDIACVLAKADVAVQGRLLGNGNRVELAMSWTTKQLHQTPCIPGNPFQT